MQSIGVFRPGLESHLQVVAHNAFPFTILALTRVRQFGYDEKSVFFDFVPSVASFCQSVFCSV